LVSRVLVGCVEVARTRTQPRLVRSAGSRARGDMSGLVGSGALHDGVGARVRIMEIQRARILSAMFDVATELGAANVSVADVVERSGVSRRTFYELFADREDCFLAAFEEALSLARGRVSGAYALERGWRERIRAALVELLCFLDEEPLVGRLLIVESSSGGLRTLERRDRVLGQLAGIVDMGRGESVSAAALPPLMAEGLVGGVLSVIHARLARVDREPLLGLAAQLTSMIVLPYLGAAAARRELERPELERPVIVHAGDRYRARLLTDPFKDAGMRLTYRTVRVLVAVAELGGRGSDPSNRQVGESAGITDQGQISKLLGRLQRLGLIDNNGLGPGTGAPNAWSLTPTGRELANSIQVNTEGFKTEGESE
jgi:AcrR family transcriptional regulator